MIFDVEITDLRGFVLATTRSDRAGDGPGGGDPLVFAQYSGLEVEIPLCDSRLARVTLSAENPAVEHLTFMGAADDDSEQHLIAALGRMLRVYYRKGSNAQPIFWGPVLMLRASSTEAGSVIIEAHDPTLRLKHHFARYGDDVVGESGDPPPANPTDFTTLWELLEAGQNTLLQNNYPSLGIDIGTNTATYAPWVVAVDASAGNFTLTYDGATTGTIAYNASAGTLQTALEALSTIAPGDITVLKPSTGLWTVTWDSGTLLPLSGNGAGLTGTLAVGRSTIEIQRGANLWDQFIVVQESRYGPEFEFEPRDTLGVQQTDDLGGTWPYYCRLNTADRLGTDRSSTVIFRLTGSTDDNLSAFEWNPSGDVVKNTVTAVTQGTETSPGLRVFGHDLSSWTDIGIYVDWLNPAGGNSDVTEDGLRDLANDIVGAYSRPPQFLTLTRKLVDAQNPAGSYFKAPYGVGDTVAVLLSKGYIEVDQDVRITKITLKQHDHAGNVEEVLEVVPKVTNQANITTGAD